MIWIRRLHVINWMYYGVQSIELEGSNLLTGITGSGKSSMIDALQVVMMGEANSRYFNRSATGSKSDRTIVTYLRGKYHDSGYKRKDKAFSSYLAADFYDELNRDEFCYGVAFDLAEDNTVEKDFFYVGKKFQREWALKPLGDKKAARSRKEFKGEMKERGIPLKLFTPGEYKQDLLVRLGIYDEHFFQVFRTAVAYVPLDKIEDFIVKNICHMEDNIDVQGMKSAIHEYQRMQRDMADFQERQRRLEEIKGIYDEFFARSETLRTQDYIIQRACVDRLREEQLAAEASKSDTENEYDLRTKEDNRLKALIQEKETRHTELVQQIAGDPTAKRQEELRVNLNACSQKMQECKGYRDKQLLLLGQRLAAWKRLLFEAAESPAAEELNRAELAWLSRVFELYGQYNKDNFTSLDSLALSEANNRLEQLRNQALVLQTSWKSLRDEAKRRAEGYRAQLRELEKGVKSYPADLLALKTHLQDVLSQQNGMSVQVSILADLISITDAAWVNVTEGYLRRQRLYLLVLPKHYQEAVLIFKKYSRENKCYQYRLVNTGGVLAERLEVFDNSLAKIIDADQPAARKYVDYLLGRVERVENIEKVSGRRTALTVDGMLYSGFTAARMNEDDWRMKYIGQDSIRRQIEEISRLLDEEIAQIGTLDLMIAPLQLWTDEKTLSNEFLASLEQAVEKARELPALEQEYNSLHTQLLTIDDSYVQLLRAEQKQTENEIDDLREKGRNILQKMGQLFNQRNIYDALAQEKGHAWEEELALFSLIYPAGNEVAERTTLRYENELRQKGSAEKLQQDFEPALSQTKTRLDTLIQNFRQKVEAFNLKHIASSISTEMSSGEWRKAYEEVQSVHLEEFTEQVAAARGRAEEIFRNGFINQIKRNIDTVKREINLLNKALEEYMFGKIQYRFKCVPTENAELRQYYDMITHSRLDGASIYDLLELGTDLSEYEPLVKTLFQMISSEGTDLASRQQVEANIEKFKSFHTYLRFDLVEVGADGKEYPLSQTMGSKSGGERQTPFYVAILASLMKTYRVNQSANSLRLVVFDEAFDKIDTSRIEECISMLKEIGFQSVIVAPDNKAPYIAPLVECTWVVLKPDDKTSVIHRHYKSQEDAI